MLSFINNIFFMFVFRKWANKNANGGRIDDHHTSEVVAVPYFK